MPEHPIHGSKYFDVREFVDSQTWNALGASAAWLIDPAIVRVADLLRELADAPVKINNWHYAKRGEHAYRSSGFRRKSDPTGAAYSQHRCGRAADFKVSGFSPSLVHILVEQNREAFLRAGLTTLEALAFTPTWVHCDVRPRIEGIHPENNFLFVSP
jgi:hypothetical protein